jgi:hypothetical protein
MDANEVEAGRMHGLENYSVRLPMRWVVYLAMIFAT